MTTLIDPLFSRIANLYFFRAAATSSPQGGAQLVMGQFRAPHHIFNT